MPYGAKTINEMYEMEGQKHGSKFKKMIDNPNREKIARKLTDGKGKWGQGKGEQKTINRGDLTEKAKVWFYFLASIMVPTKHVCTVREQEAIIIYAMLKGYNINAGAVIENSIMRYHEGNKRGLIPHSATTTKLCLRAGVKGTWEEEEECPKVSLLTLTGVSKGPRNQKKKGIIIEADSREENENARQKEDTLLVADQEEEDPEAHPEENTFMFAEDREQDNGSPINLSTPLASSPPIRNRDFREPGESSRGAQGNNKIMEMLSSIQKRMEEREREWNLQQKFREEVYESELKRKYQQWEEEMNRREEKMKEILEHQEEKFKKEMEERDHDLLKKLQLSHESFYNNQYDRDSQLLTIIKKRDSDQESKTMEQIKGLKFLYMSMFKDLEKKMKERDKELDDKDAFRRKVWLENLDLINNNLPKFLEVMTEMENTMNTLGKRQDDLNKKVDLTNKLILEEQIERENDKKKRTEMKFPKFSHNLATLDLDPPNIFAPPPKRKK